MARYFGRLPAEVDAMPVVLVSWLTNQLVRHESSRAVSEAEAKWWNDPSGFDYTWSPADDEEMFPLQTGLPPGWEKLPREEA